MMPVRLFFVFALCSAWARAAEVDLVRVWPGYREAESFVGIAEYFGGSEPKAGRLILRTQPTERGGYYWVTRIKVSQPVPKALIELSVIQPGQAQPVVHRWPFRLDAGSQAVWVGLTGADWPRPSTRPVAWRLRIIDRDTERELAAEQSFLWAPQ